MAAVVAADESIVSRVIAVALVLLSSGLGYARLLERASKAETLARDEREARLLLEAELARVRDAAAAHAGERRAFARGSRRSSPDALLEGDTPLGRLRQRLRDRRRKKR